MEDNGGLLCHLTLSVHMALASLMYAYRYGMKEKYFKTLKTLKKCMDERLYTFYYDFGCESRVWNDNSFQVTEDYSYGK